MLKPEVSIPAGLATAALVYGVYQHAVPNIADHRAVEADNPDAQSARRQAAWTSAAVVAGVSLLAKDPTIFVIGGAMLVALDWSTRHADAVNPITGAVDRVIRRTEQGEPVESVDDVGAAYAPAA